MFLVSYIADTGSYQVFQELKGFGFPTLQVQALRGRERKKMRLSCGSSSVSHVVSWGLHWLPVISSGRCKLK